MKRNFSKALVVVVFYWTVALMGNCDPCKDGAPDFYFNWTNIGLENLRLIGSAYDYRNTIDSVFTQNDYGVQLNLGGKLIALNKPQDFGLINGAYALSCHESIYFTKNDVQKIDIVTLNSFDSKHLAGSGITDYFEEITYDGNGKPNGYRLFDYGPNPDLTEYHNNPSVSNYDIAAFLRKKPELDSVQRFVVRVSLKDGEVFSDTTSNIRLK